MPTLSTTASTGPTQPANVDACAPIVAYEAEPDITKAVRGVLTSVITYATNEHNGARGCFLASCVSTSVGEVEGVDERMEKAIKGTDVRLASRFGLEKEQGTLPPNFPSQQRGRLMYDMRQGFVFRGGAGWSGETLLEDIEDRVQMILAI